MKKYLCLTALLALASVALAADLKRSDKSFITNSYENGLAEVSAANLALRKTANQEIKTFAEMMANEHGKANSELQSLAGTKSVELVNEPTMIAKGKEKLLDRKSGADFDKEYIDDAVKSHKKSVEAFEKAANEAEDADVKAFASKTLPTLKHHLSMAEDLQGKIGK